MKKKLFSAEMHNFSFAFFVSCLSSLWEFHAQSALNPDSGELLVAVLSLAEKIMIPSNSQSESRKMLKSNRFFSKELEGLVQ